MGRRKKRKTTNRKEEFNIHEELKHIALWISIAIGISGASWKFFGVPSHFIPFITIISILIIVIILQYKKIKALESKE